MRKFQKSIFALAAVALLCVPQFANARLPLRKRVSPVALAKGAKAQQRVDAALLTTTIAGVKYQRYINVRYKYSVQYPKKLLAPQGESDNSDGQRFLSKDSSVELAVWGSHALDSVGEPVSLSKKFAEEIQNHPATITSKLKGKGWFSVSRKDKGTISVSKTLLKDGDFKSFQLNYPVKARTTYDPIADYVSKTFQSTL